MTTMALNSNAAISTTTDQATDLQQTIWKQLKSLMNKIMLTHTVYNERRALRKISDEILHDMGLTRAEINLECDRSVFDIPAHRK